jgi:signal transduction histidine kinase
MPLSISWFYNPGVVLKAICMKKPGPIWWRFWLPAIAFPTFCVACFGQTAAGPNSPIILTNIQQVLASGNAALETNPQPVRLRGVLTARSPGRPLLYLQDREFALAAEVRDGMETCTPGQLLEVEGIAVSSPAQPRIRAESVRVISTARLPAPKRGDPYKIVKGEDLSRYLTIRGVVRDLLLENGRLVYLIRHGVLHFRAVAPAPPGTQLPRDLIDAEIDMSGACEHVVDAQGAIAGFSLIMPTNYFRVRHAGTTTLFDRPLTTIAQFHDRPDQLFMRSKLAGTVLAHFAGKLFLQDDTGVVRAELVPLLPRTSVSALDLDHEVQSQLEPGERIELIGLRWEDHSPLTFLYDGEFRRMGHGPVPIAKPATANELRTFTNAHQLVTLKGRLVGSRTVSGPNSVQQIWILETDGQAIHARLDGLKLPDERFPPQTWLMVTGIHEVYPHEWPALNKLNLRLRSSADLAMAPPPPFWSRPEYRKFLTIGIAVSLVGVVFVVFQQWQMRRLERRVTERTAELRAEVAAREAAQDELHIALNAEKELNQLKSSFVSMVSHEFRTPLEVILSSSNILDRYFDRLPSEKRAAQLSAIRKNVHRMNGLIADVLTLGRFEAGRMECCPTALDLEATCRQVCTDVESAAEAAGRIRFTGHDLGEQAAVDETLLQHILSNLLSNGLKYSAASELVEFTVSRRGVDGEFVIRDRGCGIPESDRARLFTAFHRGRNVGQTPGTGLGLVIVKRCVECHGGTLRFDSVEGQGTTFTVTLPVFAGTRFFRNRSTAAAPTSIT